MTLAQVEAAVRRWLEKEHGLRPTLTAGQLVGCQDGDELDLTVARDGDGWVVDLAVVMPGPLGKPRPGTEQPVAYVDWNKADGWTFEGPV